MNTSFGSSHTVLCTEVVCWLKCVHYWAVVPHSKGPLLEVRSAADLSDHKSLNLIFSVYMYNIYFKLFKTNSVIKNFFY